MEKYKVNLTDDQEEELVTSLNDICEDNEKHQRSALYYLVSGALCCHSHIKMSEWVLKNNKFDKDHNCFCGCNIYFGQINKVKNNKDWLPEKEKEVHELYGRALKAFELYDKFADEKMEYILPHMQVQQYLLSQYEKLINYVLEKENIRSILTQESKEKHKDIVKFHMDVGKYYDPEIQFLLDHFIYNILG